MDAEGRLEQMVETFGDSNVQPGIGELKHDFVKDVGVGPVALLSFELEKRKDSLIHGVPPVDRVFVLWHQVCDVSPQALIRNQCQDFVPSRCVAQNVLVMKAQPFKIGLKNIIFFFFRNTCILIKVYQFFR